MKKSSQTRQLRGGENRLNELEERKERKTIKEIEEKRKNILQCVLILRSTGYRLTTHTID
jgi:hypothetical protein